MSSSSRTTTPAVHWLLVGAALETAGAVIFLTTSLRWLAVVVFLLGTASLVMGARSVSRR